MTRRTAAADLAAYLRNSPDVAIGDLGGLNLDATKRVPQSAPADTGRVAQAIILPLPPSANVYWRNFRGRTVVSAAARAYKAGVWLQAQHAGFTPFAGPVAVYVHVYRARKAGDLDNFGTKVLGDALNGIAYQDDSQIAEWHLWRHDDKANPRVEVEIRRLEDCNPG